jgi:Fe-S cluster assembly protein SufD
MTQTMTEPQTTDYASLIAQVASRAETAGTAALNPLRAEAARQFAELGIPTTRHEDWRYTNLKRLEAALPLAEPNADVSSDDISRFMIPDLDASLLVFVDGHYRADLSTPPESSHDAGVAVGTLAETVKSGCTGIVNYLGKQSAATDDAMTALNSATFEDGVVVYVKQGKELDKPLHVLSVATGQAVMTAPRNLIVAEKDAKATVLEHYVALTDGAYFTNAVTEIFADDQAVVHHYMLERESEEATNISTLYTHQGTKSDIHSHTVLLGGALVRNNVRPVLAGEDGHCLINGLFVGHHEQHLDNAMHVNHAAPNCRSRQFYKGIMNHKSHGVFTGRIVVDRIAQQTDAIQNNRNMLLTEDARMNARPQLEIYADDVRCTHGATTGQVDPEAVFYFRARGLAEDVARAMLIYAFAAEGFDRMQLVPVRQLLAEEMIAKLPMANKLSAEFSREVKERLYRI